MKHFISLFFGILAFTSFSYITPAAAASVYYTNTTNITLTLTCSDTQSGCAKMRFSNDNSTWSPWENFNTTKPWVLAAGDGVKTIYIQYEDNVGNINPPITIDSIYLDTVNPTCSSSISPSTMTTSPPVIASATCNDTGGSGCIGATNPPPDQSLTVNGQTATFTVTDKAGNNGSCISPPAQICNETVWSSWSDFNTSGSSTSWAPPEFGERTGSAAITSLPLANNQSIRVNECESTQTIDITTTAGSTIIADGIDTHKINFSISTNLDAPTIADDIQLIFADTIRYDQTVPMPPPEAASPVSIYGNVTRPSTTRTITLPTSAISLSTLAEISSFAPSDANNTLLFTGVKWRAKPTTSPLNISFEFNPAVTITSVLGWDNLVENIERTLQIEITNNSPTRSYNDYEFLLETGNPYIDFIDFQRTKVNGTNALAPTPEGGTGALSLYSSGTTGLNILGETGETPSPITTGNPGVLAGGQTYSFEFILTPKLLAGSAEVLSYSELIPSFALNNPSQPSPTQYVDTKRSANTNIAQFAIIGTVGSRNADDIIIGTTTSTVEGVSREKLKTVIYRNIASLTRNAPSCDGTSSAVDVTSAPSDCTQTNNENQVTYIEGDAYLTGGAMANRTVIVKGGDLYITGDMTDGNSFGLIVIPDSNGNGGNIFLAPNVQNTTGAWYAENAMISAKDSNGNNTISTNERYYGTSSLSNTDLIDQWWHFGTVVSSNTINGSLKTPPECPVNVTNCSLDRAKQYDLTYMRRYTSTGGGAASNVNPAYPNNPGVIEYDARVQTNPPAGFASQ